MTYIVKISDTHIGTDEEFILYGLNPFERIAPVLTAIAELPTRPAAILHMGDLVEKATPESYALLTQLLDTLDLPLYCVSGNHDDTAMIKKLVPMGPKDDWTDDESLLVYTVPFSDHLLLILDAVGGVMPDDQIAFAQQTIRESSVPVAVCLHYPSLETEAPWFDKNMLMKNGAAFHEAMVQVRANISAVFFGHLHCPLHMIRDGVNYICAGSTFADHYTWPREPGDDTHPDIIGAGEFQLLSLKETGIDIRPWRG